MKKIDARGLSCPQPVVLVQNAIKSGSKNLEVLVDLEVAKENILRCSSHNKLKSEVRQSGEDFVITISP